METKLLEVFRTVARYGSITAAARSLRFTQSAVSRQIAALEAEIGARVFDRLPRGVALTEQGRTLLPHAEAVLDRLTASRRDLDQLHGLGGGRLRVGAFPTAVAALIPRAMAAFRSAYPRVAMSLVEGLTPALLERLAAGDADIAVVSSSPTGQIDTTGFDLHHLLDERLLVAVSRQHRLARRRTVRLAELADDSFIAGSATAENTLLRASLARVPAEDRYRRRRVDRQAGLCRSRPRRRARSRPGRAGQARRHRATTPAYRRRVGAPDLRRDRSRAHQAARRDQIPHTP